MRLLGKTGLLVSEICLGTGSFDAVMPYSMTGVVSQAEADEMVSLALDSGVNFFNTAEAYSKGRAETALGKALGRRRHEAVIVTKVHPTREDGPNVGGFSKKHIISACEDSLRRLGTDYIDIFELHAMAPETPIEITLRALEDLARSGKVRYFGCSNFHGWQVMKGLAVSDGQGWDRFVTYEGQYNLLCRELEYEIAPVCIDQGVAILAYSPLHGGFLSGKYRRGESWPEGARFKSFSDGGPWEAEPEKLYAIVEQLFEIGASHGGSAADAALNYVLSKPGVGAVIVGVRNIDQFRRNLKALTWTMSAEETALLDGLSEPERKYPYFVFDPKQSA